MSADIRKAEFPGPFWLVAYDQYYPAGGLNNVIGAYATEAEATAELDRRLRSSDRGDRYDSMYIVEIQIGGTK